MYDIGAFSLDDMIHCSSALRGLGEGATRTHETAERIVQILYDRLAHPTTGERSCSLVRFFETRPFEELDQARQQFAIRWSKQAAPAPETTCLGLVATAGEEPSWGDPLHSSAHLAIPIPSEEALSNMPMVAKLCEQLGIEKTFIVRPDKNRLNELAKKTYDVFFIENAVNCPWLPAQAGLVETSGIASVVGLGGVLPNGHIFVVLLFCKISIPDTTAALFRPLALAVKLALAVGTQHVSRRARDQAPTGVVTHLRHDTSETTLLEARVAALEGLLGEHERAALLHTQNLAAVVNELSTKTERFEATLRSIVDGVIICDVNGKFLHYNEAAESMLGTSIVADAPPEIWSEKYGVFQMDGRTPYPTEELPLVRAMRGETICTAEMVIRHAKNPEGTYVDAIATTIQNAKGEHLGAVVLFRDIGERKRHELDTVHRLHAEIEKNDLLERLRLAVNELSTPILEVWDEILALPLIGVVDSARAEQMMTRLLDAIIDKKSRFVIIDVTGVHILDTATADHLLKLVRAVELLGARCVLSGIRSSVAQTLVELGVSFGSLLTQQNLKHSLRTCINWRENKRERVGLAPHATRGSAP